MLGKRRTERGTSPMPFDRYDNFRANLNENEYGVINRIPPPAPPQHHFFRNALRIGGLGLGIGALYKYREPLLKLGHGAYNYARDKFHNLLAPTNQTSNIPINDHDA